MGRVQDGARSERAEAHVVNASLLVDAAGLEMDRVIVEGEDHRHLFRARRLGPGDSVRVTDGAGRQRSGTVALVDRRSAAIDLGGWLAAPSLPRAVTVFVATPRAERARWIVEKLVELGVERICFVHSERVNHLLGRQIERLERVAKSALLQCGSVRLPRLEELRWDQLLGSHVGAAEYGFLLAPGAEVGLLAAAADLEVGASVDLWIGPEGGFTAVEEETLTDRDVRPVHLGPLILRVETAATVAAGFLLAG